MNLKTIHNNDLLNEIIIRDNCKIITTIDNNTKLNRDILREDYRWECKNNIKDYLKNKINNI